MACLSWKQVEQFLLILLGFWCMGAGCGFERSLLPRMAVQTFHQAKASTRLSFVATFGLFKSIANAVAGPLADRWGRKPILILGCLVGLPVMPYVIWAQSWHGITMMNAAFGLSQGLLGSSLFFLMIDVMGPRNRGVAVGVGECTIYVSTAVVNILAGRLASAHGFRPVPFYVATGFSLLGLLAAIPLNDTLDAVRAEQESAVWRSATQNNGKRLSAEPSGLDEEHTLTSPGAPNSTFEGYVTPWQGKSVRNVGEVDALVSSDGMSQRSWAATSQTCSVDRPDPEPEGHAAKEDYSSMLPADRSGVPDTEALHSDFITKEGRSENSIAALDVQDEDAPPDESAFRILSRLLRRNPSYVSLCFAGMAINFKDGFAWGSFPVFFKHEQGLTDSDTDLLVAVYPLCWGFSQSITGLASDRFGRKIFLVAGLAACALSMALYVAPGAFAGPDGEAAAAAPPAARRVRLWLACDVLLGVGTASVYPALQAGAADEVDPINRGLALGFYRSCRDMGYVVGAIVCGHLTDAIGYAGTFLVNALILLVALLLVAVAYHPKAIEDEEALPEVFLASTRAANGTSHAEEEKALLSLSTRLSQRRLVHRCSDSY